MLQFKKCRMAFAAFTALCEKRRRFPDPSNWTTLENI